MPPRAAEEPKPSSGPPPYQTGIASYYASKFAGRKTANGERYDPTKMTAAHRHLPFGTLVEVRARSGRRIVVRINDRGPFGRGRVIDLSRTAAEQLGMIRAGIIPVELRIVKPAARAR